MPNLEILEASLKAISPTIVASTRTDEFVVDGMAPALVVAPATMEDVAAALAVAGNAGAAVIPWGGGTQMSLGMLAHAYDIAIDLRRLDRIVEYEPADLTVSVEAGLRLSVLQRRLGDNGQWLPLDPAVSEQATVGGVLATNVSGPARVRYGTPRDVLIGVRFATPAGEIVHAGGRVVKNVAGYDLGKLQIGALGTLGVIVEATFKVSPLPETTRWLTLSSTNATSLMLTSLAIRDLNLAVTAFILRHAPGDDVYTMHVRCAAGSAAVERSLRDIAALAARAGLTFAHADAAPVAHNDVGRTTPVVRVRCSVTPSATGEIVETLAKLEATVESYPTAGIVYATWPVDAVTPNELGRLREICVVEGRGALVLESAPTELKGHIDVWGDPPAGFELMRNLKAEFDPTNTLNPGRFLGGI